MVSVAVADIGRWRGGGLVAEIMVVVVVVVQQYPDPPWNLSLVETVKAEKIGKYRLGFIYQKKSASS